LFGYQKKKKEKKNHQQYTSFLMEEKLDFGALPPKPGPDYGFNSCLYNSTQFWQDSRAHTRVLAFMNLLGCECHADWMNSGHKTQTSTMTLFIQSWLPECRLTLWVINFTGQELQHQPCCS
jgi:hypothetical protein